MIQRVTGESENSKMFLYYHCDGKDELSIDFLDYVLVQLLDSLPREDRTPKEGLETLVDTLLPGALPKEAYRL